MFRIYLFSLAILFIVSCSASRRAMNALNAGDQCGFCKISAESLNADVNSINNLGVCYDHGYCGYPKDRSKAIEQFRLAARWGVPKAIENLKLYGIVAPSPDLKLAKNTQNNEELKKALIASLASGLAIIANHNTSPTNNNPSGTYNNFDPPQQLPIEDSNDLRGCCSRHKGISRDAYSNPNCHFSGMVLCNDFNPSPSCNCQ